MSIADADSSHFLQEEGLPRVVPSDEHVWRASLVVALIGLCLIGLMLCLSALAPSSAGWVAVFGAAFVFGSTGIPMKVPSLSHVSCPLFA